MRCAAKEVGENSISIIKEKTGCVFTQSCLNSEEKGILEMRNEGGKGGALKLLQWCEPLYFGEEIRNGDKIRARLDENKWTPGVYLLTFSENPHHLMEILPALSLKQTWARKLCPVVFGMAGSKEDAIDLACRIIKEVYDKTGDFGIEDYMKNR